MEKEIRSHVYAVVAALTIFVLQAAIGGWLESTGRLTADDLNMPLFKGTNFAVFTVLCFSIVRPFLRSFVSMQTKIGNGELAAIRLIRNHERLLTWIIWIFFCIGLAIALPVMLRDGFFK